MTDGAKVTDTVSAPGDADGAQEVAPVLRIVRGQPTPEEIAALVAVIVSGSGAAGAEPAAPRKASGWTDRSRYVHAPGSRPGGGWRASAFPR